MLVGHFAVGLLAKPFAPKVSLGTLTLAAVLPDLLGFVFAFAGIEHFAIKPGLMAANSIECIDYPFSHSLLMGVVWGALLGGIYFRRGRDRHGAWVLLAAVLSHWVLDVVSHRPDMPLVPGLHVYFGLGLWNSIPATILVEGTIWLGAIVVYVRSTRAIQRTGTIGWWIVVALLTLAWRAGLGAPPPPTLRAFEVQGLIFFSLVVAWAYWMNRVRRVRAVDIAGAHPVT